MRTELTIKCDKSPGVLARVIVALRRFDANLTKQKMTEAEDHRMLALTVEGPNMPVSNLLNAVMAIPGVDEVLSGADLPQAAVTSSPVRNAGDSAAVAIAEAFPDILDLINAHRATLAQEQAPELMFALGVEVATLRRDAFADVPDTLSVSEFISTRVLPELAGLGDVDMADDDVRVLSSIFSKPKKGQKASGFGFRLGSADTLEKCDFLSGYLQGMMEVTPAMRYGHVEETMCRKEGQPYCLFHFEQN